MNVKFLYIILLIGYVSTSFAQDAKFKIYGERTGEVVSLAWIPEFWPANMEGVIIQRRSGSGNWEAISNKTIVPSSYAGKDLSNVEQSAGEQKRLNDKLIDLIANGKAKPMSEKDYFENILQNPVRLSGISFVFAIDYDLMLLNGFGCTDRKVISGYAFEYGIFPVVSGAMANEPIATYHSPADDQPDFNLKVETKAEVIGNNAKVRLHWHFDLMKFREMGIKGFNIYYQKDREGKKLLNDKIIWITSNNNPADLNYLISFPETNINYYAVPVSYFGTEGEGYRLPFQPGIYNISIPAPKLTFELEDQTLKLNWLLEHGYDTLIREIKVMKKLSTNDFEVVATLDATYRDFNEDMNDAGEKARYKIIAEAQIGREIWSNEVIVTYTPMKLVTTPGNLNGKIIKKEGVYYIKLTWDYSEKVSDVAFRIFTDGPRGNLIYDSSFPHELKSPFEIEVKRIRGELKHFAIQAISTERKTSSLSNEIELITPTIILPPINITKLEVVANEVNLDWKFSDEIVDLNGFEILVDSEVYLSENEVNKEKRATILKGLAPGKHYVIITAITQYGLQKSTYKKSFLIP